MGVWGYMLSVVAEEIKDDISERIMDPQDLWLLSVMKVTTRPLHVSWSNSILNKVAWNLAITGFSMMVAVSVL